MVFTFAGMELDVPAMELRTERGVVPLEPQVFDVLAHLVRNHDRVVTRTELLDEVWGHRFVTDATLSSRIMSARRAVGDSGSAQSVIRTVRGRGFRVVAEVARHETASGASPAPTAPPRAPVEGGPGAPPGRRAELSHLTRLARESLAGARRLVVIGGEAGIGKTALLEALLADPVVPSDALVLRCPCMERRGPEEAYTALLNGLASACGDDRDGARLAAELAWRAPGWVAQMPWLLRIEEVADTGPVLGVTPERMLREIVEALEAISAQRPVVVAVDDAQWCGPSSLDVLAALASRDVAGRILLVATARPSEDRSGGLRSVMRELAARGRAVEVALGPLGDDALREHLVARLGPDAANLVAPLRARSGGNPLFARETVDWWIEHGLVAAPDAPWREPDLRALAGGVPETLRGLVEEQLGRLADVERRIVEAAAVASPEASAAAVAAAAGVPTDEAEATLDRLARAGRMIVERGGEQWPDGTFAGRYGFGHDAVREIVEQAIPPGRRARMHGLVGERLEAAFGASDAGRAAELSRHLLAAHETARAVPYLRLAGEQALARAAYREGRDMLEDGLRAVAALPASDERDKLELLLLTPLGICRIATGGWSRPETLAAFERAHELAVRLGRADELPDVLYGLAIVREFRADYAGSAAALRARLELPGDRLRTESLELLACSSFHRGDFADSLTQARQGIARADGPPSRMLAALGENARVGCHLWVARSLSLVGSPDTALAEARRAVELSRAHPYGCATAHVQLALVHQERREHEATLASATEASRLAVEGGFAHQRAAADVLGGWAQAAGSGAPEGVERIERGLAAHEATGASIDLPHDLGLLADARLATGDAEGAREAATRALAAIGDGAFFYEPELRRLLAAALDALGDPAGAERELRLALAAATEGGARTLELRVAADLAERGLADGRDALVRALDAMEEGAETPDQRRARAVLARTAAPT